MPPPPRSLWLAPSPPLLGKFQHGAFASKLRVQRKRLHCRLFLKKNKNNHSQKQQMVKPRALACTVAYAKLKKRNNERFILKFGKLTQYFCMKSNFWTIKTVFILVKVCVYLLCTRQCQGYCLMGAWSPQAPTIYLWTTKIWNKKPEQVNENHNSQDNFCSISNKIPLSFCTFEAKTENLWSSAIGKKYFRQ